MIVCVLYVCARVCACMCVCARARVCVCDCDVETSDWNTIYSTTAPGTTLQLVKEHTCSEFKEQLQQSGEWMHTQIVMNSMVATREVRELYVEERGLNVESHTNVRLRMKWNP